MLIFIGLGLHDEKDITLRGLEEARSCDILFAEFYTSLLAGTCVASAKEKIGFLIGKEVELLNRADIEERGDVLLMHAKNKKVGLLVAGDPLISTTHVHLRLRAKELGIETRVVHNASIYSAAPSISGLQNYKFGRSATIAIPEAGFSPETPYNVVKENRERGLHTLLFLDIKAEKKEYMTANQGMQVMLQIEKKRKERVFTEETLCVVLGSVGSYDCVLKAGKVKDLIKQDFGSLPHSLIVPGKLHFIEEEYLRAFGG
ncbi:MAG: diphthine synthase [Methanobacteriota archaeon]